MKMKPVLKSVKINYLHVFIVYVVFYFTFWILPFLAGKYADSSFPYIQKEDIFEELVGMIDSENSKELPWCPNKPPNLSPKLNLYSYNVNFKKSQDQQLAIDLNIMPGGLWKPSNCQSRYEVCSFYETNLISLFIYYF